MLYGVILFIHITLSISYTDFPKYGVCFESPVYSRTCISLSSWILSQSIHTDNYLSNYL